MVKAAKKVETLVDDAQKAATEQMDKVTKSMEEVAAFGQDNMDALVKSSTIAVKAAEDFNAEQYRNIGESARATLKFRKPG